MALFVMAAGHAKAQIDPHFSQYYAYPLWLNPAMTGVFNGSARVSANVRDQWATVGNGYRTGGLSADFRSDDKAAFGINILNQAAGSAGYNYFAAYGSFGYGVAVSSDGMQKLHFGVQAGVINRSFDPSKLQFDDQYNAIGGFDPNIPSGENFTTTNATVFDASAGIFYYDSNPMNIANIFGGVSLAHLADSNDPFATDGIKSKLPMRLTIHGGVKIRASDIIDVTPNFIYMREQQNQLRAVDVYSELKFGDSYGLILNGMYRFDDAATAGVGYHINSMLIGLSYDFNTSSLNSATNGKGGFEFSMSYIFGNTSKAPAEICPRI